MCVDATFAGISQRPRVVHVVTSDLAVVLMRGQLQYLQRAGFDVTLICSPRKWLDTVGRVENVHNIELPMGLEIAPLRGSVSLFRFCRILHAPRPAVTY